MEPVRLYPEDLRRLPEYRSQKQKEPQPDQPGCGFEYMKYRRCLQRSGMHFVAVLPEDGKKVFRPQPYGRGVVVGMDAHQAGPFQK